MKRCNPTCDHYRPAPAYRSVPREEARCGSCALGKRDVWTGGIWTVCPHDGPHQAQGRLPL